MELVNYCFDTRYADFRSIPSGAGFPQTSLPADVLRGLLSRIHFSPTDGFSYERVAHFNREWIFSKLDSGFQSLVGFRILSAGFRIPKPRIPDSTSKKFLDSGIRIPLHGATYASNGSFNPQIITNKEAHLVNGNPACQRIQTPVNLPKPNHIYKNVLVKKYRSHCLVHAFLPVEQMHFRNYCLDFPGKFSCAIDCFMELSCYIFK